MYNSEEVYTFEQNRQNQTHPSHPSSMDQQKNNRISNSKPKNSLVLGPKANLISGTYTRIVPKKPIHDMQRLYAENMQLRQKIQVLQENSTKIKTRLAMTQKQKQQLINQIYNSDFGASGLRQRRPSQKGLTKTHQKLTKPQNDQNRRILNSYKDQISKIKEQNAKLKKTVKYTQIQQLQTENRYLHGQIIRVKNYAKDIIQNTQYDDYERQIQSLNKIIKQEKDGKRTLQLQLKKKDQQLQELKNKMKIIVNRKTQLEKKYTRQVNTIKSQLHKAKQKQKQFYTNQDIKENKKVKNVAECKNCVTYKENIQINKKKIAQLDQKLSMKQKQIAELNNKLKQAAIKKQIQVPTQPQNSHQLKKQTLNTKPQQKEQIHSSLKDSNIVQKQTRQQVVKNNNQKKLQSQSSNYDDQYDDQQNYEQSEDKIDVFHVNLNDSYNKQVKSNQKSNKDTSNGQQTKSDFKKLKKQFQANESQQQVLFQKQENSKPQKNQNQKKKSKQLKQRKQESGKNKQKTSNSKAEKILKQTIKYRLIAQRYQYSDFHRDIKNSGVTQFTVEQLINMLQNQPFFLQQVHLKMVLFNLFDRDELSEEDSVTIGVFLKKMKNLIGQFQLKSQDQEQKILKSIQSKLNKKKILSKLSQQALGEDWISKKGFVQVLKQSGGLTENQIQQCLAQASVLSLDIAHINYSQFLQKLGYS